MGAPALGVQVYELGGRVVQQDARASAAHPARMPPQGYGPRVTGVDDGAAVARKMAAGGVAAVLGAAVHGPDGVAIAAMAPPVIEHAITQFQVGAHSRGAALTRWAIRRSGVTAEEFDDLVSKDERRAALVVRAAEAAWTTLDEIKVRALAAVLAEGVTDATRLDIAGLLTGAIRQIEKPHVQILDRLAAELSAHSPSRSSRALSVEELAGALPGLAEGVAALVAALNSVGCLAASNASYGDQMQGTWRITDFGQALLKHISAARREVADA